MGDFFGGAFNFLSDVGQGISNFFGGDSSGVDAIASDASDAQVDDPNFSQVQGFFGGSGDTPDSASANSTGLLSTLAKTGAQTLSGSRVGSQSSGGRMLTRPVGLTGRIRQFPEQIKPAGVARGLKSENPQEVSAYWTSLMRQFAYGNK